jgi:outer membrane protein assembly factor BamB
MRFRLWIGALVFSLVGTVSALALDWPNWRGPNYDGVSRETDWSHEWPESGPKLLWKSELGTGFSSFSVKDGRVFTMGNTARDRNAPVEEQNDVVFCLDALTGKEIWAYKYPSALQPVRYEGGPNMTPTLSDGRVYVLSRQTDLFCLNAADGKVVWKTKLIESQGARNSDYGVSNSPVIIGDRLFVNGGGINLALNKNTGDLIWKTPDADTIPAGYSSYLPVQIGDTACLASFEARGFSLLRQNDGKRLWSHPWITQWNLNIADPVLVGDRRIFISSGYNRGATLLNAGLEKPVVIWESRSMRNHFNSSVYLDGFLYGFDDNQLACLDANTGQTRWTTRDFGKGSLVATADKRLLLLSDKGLFGIAKANPDAFELLAQGQILEGKCWTAPVLSNGLVYARNARGNMVCLDLRPAN